MKNKIKLGLILTVLLLALPGITACAGGDQEGVSQQLVKVERGDLTVSVTGSGTIEASREASLTFGSSGKVEEILVKEGDEVREGDVLAGLDMSPLKLAYAQSQLALTQAEVALTQARLAQKTTEKSARDAEDTLKLALLNAEISLGTAKFNLEETQDLYTWSDIKAAKADVDDAERYLEEVLDKAGIYLPQDELGQYPDVIEYVFGDEFTKTPGYEIWQREIVHAQARLNTARDTLDAMLYGFDTEEVAVKRQQVQAAEMTVAQAQRDLGDLAEDVSIQDLQVMSAGQSVVEAEQAVELAHQSLDDAQRQIDEASIIAPFDGVIAQVLAKEGDIAPSPSMAPKTIVYMIDPNLMELVVEVDEIDIPLVSLGQEAVINVDALPDTEFKGTVIAVHPVPKEEGGVLLYDVRLSLDILGDSGIRVGMSASADILFKEHRDVLVVPSRAIEKNAQGQTIVKVMAGEVIQERVVVVGLDDGLRTEIVSGLQEGETVVVEVKVQSISTSMF